MWCQLWVLYIIKNMFFITISVDFDFNITSWNSYIYMGLAAKMGINGIMYFYST